MRTAASSTKRLLSTARSSSTIRTTNTTLLRTSQHRKFTTIPPRRDATQNLKALWGILPKTGETMPNHAEPEHEMAYFKGLATSTRAFGEFRRVLHTGLYSQLVVMEVPVGGEIGE